MITELLTTWDLLGEASTGGRWPLSLVTATVASDLLAQSGIKIWSCADGIIDRVIANTNIKENKLTILSVFQFAAYFFANYFETKNLTRLLLVRNPCDDRFRLLKVSNQSF
jgi:hypothetical protein